MSKTEIKKRIAGCKARLKERRKQCDTCNMRGWGDCGYCAVPMCELTLAIERYTRMLTQEAQK